MVAALKIDLGQIVPVLVAALGRINLSVRNQGSALGP
jgi:hypothetical protein